MKKLSVLMAALTFCAALVTPTAAAAETDGFVFSTSDYMEKGIKVSQFLGTATKGYDYGILFSYAIGEANEIDMSEWTQFSPDDTSDFVRFIGAEGQTAWDVDPEAFTGYEIDLGQATPVAGYVMHYMKDVWGNADNWLGINDFDLYTSVDGSEWTKMTSTKDTPIERALYEAGGSADGYMTGGKGTYGTYYVGDEINGVLIYSDHAYLDVKFDNTVEARYIRVAITSTYHKNFENDNRIDSPSFPYGIDIYKGLASDIAPVEEAVVEEPVVETPVVEELVVEAPIIEAPVVEETVAAPAPATAPQTFNVAVIAAVSAVISLAGYAASRKIK